MKCCECEKLGILRQMFEVDWYGNTTMLEEYKYYCDDCWYFYCLCVD